MYASMKHILYISLLLVWDVVFLLSDCVFPVFPVVQTPDRTRPTPPREGLVRTRAASPRRSVGESRYLLPPRLHRSSDPGFPPGTTTPIMLCDIHYFHLCFHMNISHVQKRFKSCRSAKNIVTFLCF